MDNLLALVLLAWRVKALESGMVSTRRGRLSKDVQPVPLAMPEEEDAEGEPVQGRA